LTGPATPRTRRPVSGTPLGFVLLATLSLWNGLAALALAVRGYRGSRAEVALAAACLWVALVCGPALALGWAGVLDATHLAIATSVTSLIVLVAGLAGRGLRARCATLSACAGQVLLMPAAALAEAWRARSFAFVGLVAAAFLIVWTAWLSWLAPSSGWDSLWYHDAIVGFAIQNHGFALVDVPANLEFVNGYPRTSECLNLWFVIFTDRRLIEVVNSLTAPVLLVAFFCIARRYSDWRVGAMGFATLLFLIPAVAMQLRSTYVDGPFLAMFLAASHFVTRPVLRVRDVLMAGLCLGLVGGMKGTGIVLVPLLLGVLALRVGALAVRRRSSLPAFGWLAVVALVGLMMLPTYVRNWQLHENPAWPLRIENGLLGVDWQGHWLVSYQRDFDTVVNEILSPPVPDGEFYDTRRNGYGNGPPLVLFPIAVLGLLFVPAGLIRRLLSRRRPERSAGNLLMVVSSALAAEALSPAWWWARMNVHGIAALLLMAWWMLGGRRWRFFAEGVLAAMVVTSLMSLYWSRPRWEVTTKQAFELLEMTTEDRAAWKASWFLGEPATMRARDEELGPGDVVAFSEDFGFPAALWNEHFSNHLVFVPLRGRFEEYLRALEDNRVEWAVVRVGSPHERAIRSKPAVWERVGMTSDVNVAFRRTSMPYE